MNTQKAFDLEETFADDDTGGSVTSALAGLGGTYCSRADSTDAYFVVPNDTVVLSSSELRTPEMLLPPPLVYTHLLDHFHSQGRQIQTAETLQDNLYTSTDDSFSESIESPCTQPQPR